MPIARTPEQQHAREILKKTTFSRDALPYSDEFEQHFAEFAARAGEASTRQHFWRVLSSAAKKGGWKGKKRGESAPDLSHQQGDTLRQLLAGRLGSRDNLPYSTAFDDIRQQFNKTTALALNDRSFWRAVCSICKQPLRADVDRLLTQAVDHFNRSSDLGRPASVLIFLLHAAEMLLKAGLLQRGCDIREPGTGYTFSFDTCLNKGTDDAVVKFLTDDERATLRVPNRVKVLWATVYSTCSDTSTR
jgi:hypothetical protein